MSPDPAPGIEDIPSDDEAMVDADELDLPDDLCFQDFDLDLDFDVDFGGDCITSCNLMDNYNLHSEFEANHRVSPSDDRSSYASRGRKRSSTQNISHILSFVNTSHDWLRQYSLYKYMHIVNVKARVPYSVCLLLA